MAELQSIYATNSWTPPWENQAFSPFTPNYYSYYLYLSKLHQAQNHEIEQTSQTCSFSMISEFSARGQEFYYSISGRKPVFLNGSVNAQEAYLPYRYFQFPGETVVPLSKVLEQEECYNLNHQSPSIPVNTSKAEQNQYSCRFYQNEFSKKPDSPVVKLEKVPHKNFTHAQLPTPNVSPSVSQPLDYAQEPQTVQEYENKMKKLCFQSEEAKQNTLQTPIASKSLDSNMMYQRPSFTYTTLCILGIKSSKDKKATADQISNFARTIFPFFSLSKVNFKNNIRTTLTKSFVKSEERERNLGRGRNGCYYLLSPLKIESYNKDLIETWKTRGEGIKATTPFPEYVEKLFEPIKTSGDMNPVSNKDVLPQPKIPCISNENLKFTDIPNSILESMDLDSEMMATDLIFGDQSSGEPQVQNTMETTESDVSESRYDPKDGTTNNKVMDANLTREFSMLSASEKEIRDENLKKKSESEVPRIIEYPRPVLTNTHLVVLAMKNSPMDFVTIGDVYKFIEGHFPFYQDMNEKNDDLWKRALKHSISENSRKNIFFRHVNLGDLNIQEKCGTKHYYSYSLVPEWRQKLIESAQNACKKYQDQIKRAMKRPELFDKIVF